MIIETPNLKLVQCSAEMLRDALAGNEQLAKRLNVTVEENWSEFGDAPLKYVLGKLSQNENEEAWWTYLPVHKQDNRLIGSGGYKGQPTDDGMVEIGYEIVPAYRKRGLATEMANGLIAHPFKDDRVNRVIAHTLAHDNPSTKVLLKCGFKKVDEIVHAAHGPVWKWELKKSH
jgi:[ribosomal protein S5]-alanine N-acetyltransferase